MKGEINSKMEEGNRAMVLESPSEQRLAVLIADDSIILCRRLERLLDPIKGVMIIGEAHTAPDACTMIEERRPDVVILDIQMPGGGGLSVLNRTKTAFPSPIFIVFTSFPSAQFRRKYLEAGADFFLDKSAEFGKLVELLDQMSSMESTSMATAG